MSKKTSIKTTEELLLENEELRNRLIESEEALNAIRNGDVDGIIVTGQKGDKVFSLASAETPYRIILEEMAEGAVSIKADGTILYYNQRFANIFSQSVEPISGLNIYKFVSRDQRGKLRKLIKESLYKRVTGILTYKSSLYESPLYLNVSLRPLPPDIAGDICIIVSDITEMQKYQDHLEELVKERTLEIEKVYESLKASEELSQAILKNTLDVLYRINSETNKFDFISPSSEIVVGYTPEELMNMDPDTSLSMIHPDDLPVFQNAQMILRKKGNAEAEYRQVTKNGEYRWISNHMSLVRNDRGRVLYRYGNIRDITNRKLSEESILRQNAILEGIKNILEAALTSPSEKSLGTKCLEIAQIITHSEFGFIGKINEDGLEDIAISNPGWESCKIADGEGHRMPGLSFKIHGIYGRVITDGRSIIVNDPSNHPDRIGLPSGHPPLDSFLGVPLIQEGKTIGLIALGNRPGGYGGKEMETLEKIAPAIVEAFSRKRADVALQNSEERFSTAFRNSPNAITITRLSDGKIIEGNESALTLLGYNLVEVVDTSTQELGIWPDPADRQKLTQALASKGFVQNEEFVLRKKDGTLVSVNLSASLITIDNQQCFLCSFTDLTGRNLVEEALKKSEQLYRAIGESMDYGIWICDADGKNIYASQSFLNLVGITQEQCSEFGWGDALHPDDAEKTMAAWKECTRTGMIWDIEHRFKGVDGEWHPVLARGIPIRDEKGNITMWAGINLDISSIKKAENNLIEAQAKLNIALENGEIGIWEWDLKTDEMIWDERMEKMFGLLPGTFGKTYKDFESLINEEDLSHVQNAIRDTLERDLAFETIFRAGSGGGKSRYISSKAFVNKDKNGKPISFTGVCFDVTSLREGTEQLVIKLNEDLLRSNKELESFAYVASHDLQEPLRMVSSFTQLLAQQYSHKLDGKAKEYISFAVDGSKRMYDLLNGLLAYSRIHSKGRAFKQVDVNKVLTNVTKNLALNIKERNAKIKVDELPVIFADEIQIIQVFQNLIANSIKFSPINPRIIVSAKSERDQYVFSVKDRGIGIEPQYFDRIFQIFQRLNTREQYEGTGIGLAICRRIAERHGGNIWVESEIGKGSTFFFSVPKNNQL